VGGSGIALSDPELPAGQMSDGRRADDTRAVGLLLYQLLAGRNPDARVVEPPPDGRLRFIRNVPPEVCEIIARSVIPQHPQYIATPEALYAELKVLAEALEPAEPPTVLVEEPARVMQFSPARTGNLPSQPLAQGGYVNVDNALAGNTGLRLSAPTQVNNNTGTLADLDMQHMSMKLEAARQEAYPNAVYPNTYNAPVVQPRRVNIPLLLLFGLALFALFFGIGYYLSTVLIK